MTMVQSTYMSRNEALARLQASEQQLELIGACLKFLIVQHGTVLLDVRELESIDMTHSFVVEGDEEKQIIKVSVKDNTVNIPFLKEETDGNATGSGAVECGNGEGCAHLQARSGADSSSDTACCSTGKEEHESVGDPEKSV